MGGTARYLLSRKPAELFRKNLGDGENIEVIKHSEQQEENNCHETYFKQAYFQKCQGMQLILGRSKQIFFHRLMVGDWAKRVKFEKSVAHFLKSVRGAWALVIFFASLANFSSQVTRIASSIFAQAAIIASDVRR